MGTGNLADEKEMVEDEDLSLIEKIFSSVARTVSKGLAGSAHGTLTKQRDVYDELDKELEK
jgi:hypothetical protein